MIYEVDFLIHPISAIIFSYTTGVLLGLLFGYFLGKRNIEKKE